MVASGPFGLVASVPFCLVASVPFCLVASGPFGLVASGEEAVWKGFVAWTGPSVQNADIRRVSVSQIPGTTTS